jgi:hypothetical protein
VAAEIDRAKAVHGNCRSCFRLAGTILFRCEKGFPAHHDERPGPESCRDAARILPITGWVLTDQDGVRLGHREWEENIKVAGGAYDWEICATWPLRETWGCLKRIVRNTTGDMDRASVADMTCTRAAQTAPTPASRSGMAMSRQAAQIAAVQ